MTTWSSTYFQNPSSLLMEVVFMMHDLAVMLMLSVVVLVFWNMTMLVYSTYFSTFFMEEHSLENLWTWGPFLLLFFILLPSLKSIFFMDSCIFCGLDILVLGHQWYWHYFASDFIKLFEMDFDSYMDSNFSRVLDTDNRLIVFYKVPIRMLITSGDVIHSWTVPSMGVKSDAVPGRLNQLCFTPKRVGVFFGQCSEICGMNHSFMPIVVEVH